MSGLDSGVRDCARGGGVGSGWDGGLGGGVGGDVGEGGCEGGGGEVDCGGEVLRYTLNGVGGSLYRCVDEVELWE